MTKPIATQTLTDMPVVVEEGRHVWAGALQQCCPLPPSLPLSCSQRQGLLGACSFPDGFVYFPGMNTGTIDS